MPTQNRYYSSGYLATTMPGGAAASGNVVVASVTNAPSSFPFTMLLDWGLTTQEAVSVSAITGTGPFTLTCTRGIDGTTAQSHAANSIAVHGVTEQDFSEPQIHLNATGPTVDPESGNTIAVHGIQSGSAVVGTTDTQTLTNKTLTSPAISGPTLSGTVNVTGTITGTTESLSAGSATGAIEAVTNTTSAPSAANVQWTANAAADKQLSVKVSGDTQVRLLLDSNGKVQWGPGGSTAVDTDLYRSGVAILTTDGFLNVGTGLTATTGNITATTGNITATAGNVNVLAGNCSVAGNAQLASTTADFAGGTGVVSVTNAGTAPTSTPTASSVLYSKTGRMKWRGTDGNDYQTGSLFALGSAVTGATGTSAQSVTGLSLALGVGTYQVAVNLVYTPTGTIGSTNTFQFSFSGTSSSANLTGVISELSNTTAANVATATSVFTSPTHVSGSGTLVIWGQIVVTVAGTLQLQFTNTTSADTLNVLAGSLLEIQPIA